MASVTGTTIVEEPSPISPHDWSPQQNQPDVEAQSISSNRRRRPSGIKRTDSTLSSTRRPSYAIRRDTILSKEIGCRTGCSSPTLERTPTIRVDDNALHGYPKLATFLGGEDGYAVYRRFAALNARNLLYHQAKLINLEHELHEMEQSFAHQKHLHYRVHHIFGSEAGPGGNILRKKYEEVSRALDKYNALLLEQQKLHKLPRPHHSVVDTIYNWINSEKSEKQDWLDHPENTIYAVWDEDRKPVQSDLVSLSPDFKTQDPFTRFFTTKGVDWWHSIYSRWRKPNDEDLVEHVYTEKALVRWMGAVTLFVASALPTASIVALYFIHSEIWRLIFIVLFSGVFASALAIFTEAKRVEVFTASVALASVQVVFVGTAFGNGNNGPNS